MTCARASPPSAARVSHSCAAILSSGMPSPSCKRGIQKVETPGTHAALEMLGSLGSLCKLMQAKISKPQLCRSPVIQHDLTLLLKMPCKFFQPQACRRASLIIAAIMSCGTSWPFCTLHMAKTGRPQRSHSPERRVATASQAALLLGFLCPLAPQIAKIMKLSRSHSHSSRISILVVLPPSEQCLQDTIRICNKTLRFA